MYSDVVYTDKWPFVRLYFDSVSVGQFGMCTLRNVSRWRIYVDFLFFDIELLPFRQR